MSGYYVTTTIDPIRAARWAVNLTYGILAGLVALAVGSELVIANPLGHGSVTLALLLFGGTITYLGFQAWFYRIATHHAWSQRLIACLACAGAGIAAPWLPSLVSLAILDTVLVALALVLSRVHRRLADQLRTAAAQPRDAGNRQPRARQSPTDHHDLDQEQPPP